ncbi:serine hydroxymethyltransferase, partial [Nocardia salmonicida]
EFTEVADIIAATLAGSSDTDTLRGRVSKLAQSVPLYQGLEDWKLV